MFERVRESWQVLTGGVKEEAISYSNDTDPDAYMWKPLGSTGKQRNLSLIHI